MLNGGLFPSLLRFLLHGSLCFFDICILLTFMHLVSRWNSRGVLVALNSLAEPLVTELRVTVTRSLGRWLSLARLPERLQVLLALIALLLGRIIVGGLLRVLVNGI